MTNSMHADHRELGYGNAEARPDGGGGESGGGARPEPVETTDGKGSPGGQTDPAYRGGDNPNAPRRDKA